MNSLKQIVKKVGFGGIYRHGTTIRCSHPELEPIRSILQNIPDYDNHDLVAFQYNQTTDSLFSAFVHRTNRGQSQGGLRFYDYDSDHDLLFDGLRLSVGMSRKNALAGLWWGGGKGIVTKPSEPYCRDTLFQNYGKFISRLRGVYVTAEDVGTSTIDTKNVLSETRFVTCIPPECGGSGNPSQMTGHGVVAALQTSLQHIHKPIEETSVAIQGAGNVSYHIIEELLDLSVKRMYVTDVSMEQLQKIQTLRDQKETTTDLILKEASSVDFESLPVDCLMPCAMGGTINKNTIPTISAKMICGAANNQLLESDDDMLLKERGIVYLPDFVINRMGIVNCCNEQYGILSSDPLKENHFNPTNPHSIPTVINMILNTSGNIGNATIAERLADRLIEEPNPIYGKDRCENIITEIFNHKKI